MIGEGRPLVLKDNLVTQDHLRNACSEWESREGEGEQEGRKGVKGRGGCTDRQEI